MSCTFIRVASADRLWAGSAFAAGRVEWSLSVERRNAHLWLAGHRIWEFMRILLYGMQSSGASAIAYTLAQRPDSLAFVDIWNMYAAPELPVTPDEAIVAKAVVTTAYPLERHRQRFRPDLTVLVLRHPVDTYNSLFGRSYANESGSIDEKFRLFEEVLQSGAGFDHLVYYEDFAFSPRSVIDFFSSIGWRVGYDALLFRRSQENIRAANHARYPEIDEYFKYGVGNIQTGGVLRDRVLLGLPWGRTAHLPELCPSTFDRYSVVRKERGDQWHIPPRAVLSCSLHAALRELAGPCAIPRKAEKLGYRFDFTGGTSKCRIEDSELLLFPSNRDHPTEITISGLPGAPFNRLRGIFTSQHPLGSGTVAQLSLKDRDGTCLASSEFTLRHCDLKNFDLDFSTASSGLSLSVAVRSEQSNTPSAYSGISIRNLRLDQAAE